MQVATEAERLAQLLTMLEARASALRAVAAPVDNGAELRQVVQQHGALLFEWLTVVLRDRLTGPRVPVTDAQHAAAFHRASLEGTRGQDPLAQGRRVLEAVTLKQFERWDRDEAAGVAVPPVHDAPKVATILFDGARP
jgi:hypothetical protein